MLWEYLFLMLPYCLLRELIELYLHLLQVHTIWCFLRSLILSSDSLQHMLICSHVSSVCFQSIGGLIGWQVWINHQTRSRLVRKILKRDSQLAEIRVALLQSILLVILLPNKLIRYGQNNQRSLLPLYGIYELIRCHCCRVNLWLICHYFNAILCAFL